ncbi:hypothetical protein ABZW11_17045 [Nonomuraea sp. NPDC004580]|uniref:hypothetical protein n=1 Tax=Nonomuraea sp. NPDC004580 TaxID=3154552 RepID=UPI0033B737BA
MTTSTINDWIRPWYPAGLVGHADINCPRLRDQIPNPVEGPGWLDPYAEPRQGTRVCLECVPGWKAECAVCDASMTDEWGDDADGPFNEAHAQQWKQQHRCEPIVRVTPPTTRKATR